MITHVVMFRPRADLAASQREALARALANALRAIPSIRRATIGRRVTHGRPYEQLMAVNYAYAALLEFEDLAGLQAYLDHPAHEALAAQFFATFEDALMYDYDLTEGEDGIARLV